jgi:hypothetical protein
MSNALHFMNADQTGPVSIEAKGEVPKKGLWDSAVTMEAVYEFKNPGLDSGVGSTRRTRSLL